MVPYHDAAVASIEAFYDHVNDPAHTGDPDTWPEGLLDTLGRLWQGETVLVCPDGSRWVDSRPLCSHDVHDEVGPGDNIFLQRLLHCRGCGLGPGLDGVMLDAATLDLHRAFCTGCRRWIDLETEDAEAERLEAEGHLAPWEE